MGWSDGRLEFFGDQVLEKLNVFQVLNRMVEGIVLTFAAEKLGARHDVTFQCVELVVICLWV